MRLLTKIAAPLFFLVITTAISAVEKEKESEKIKAQLKQYIPQLEVDEVSPSPLSGLYQITAGPMILYASQDGRYIISGDIVDLKNNNQNITEEARKKGRIAAINQIGKENMISFAPKNPKYTVTVFTDVDCGYCRKLQNDMADLNAKGIAVNYLAFPRTGPDTPTFNKMVKVWCAKDKMKAFTDAGEGKEIMSSACANHPVLKELELGLQLGVNGTPTIILEDGTVFPGYLAPDKLLDVLQKMKN